MEVSAMIFPQIRSNIGPGAVIQGTKYTVKGIGTRRGEEALVYRIPPRTSTRPSEKGITESEFEKAHSQLVITGHFNRKWFNKNFSAVALESPCNFRAMGGVFVMLGIANYRRGDFTRAV